MRLRLPRPHAGAHASRRRRPPLVEVAASLPFDPKGRRVDGMPAFPPRPPGLSAPPTPTPGTASVTQLGSQPSTERTRGSPANTWLARKHFNPSGQVRSIPAWSPPGSPSQRSPPTPQACSASPSWASSPTWQGAQPKLLGAEPRAPCLPSPELQLGDGALQGPAAAGSEGHGGSSGAAEARPGLPSRYPRARPTAGCGHLVTHTSRCLAWASDTPLPRPAVSWRGILGLCVLTLLRGHPGFPPSSSLSARRGPWADG